MWARPVHATGLLDGAQDKSSCKGQGSYIGAVRPVAHDAASYSCHRSSKLCYIITIWGLQNLFWCWSAVLQLQCWACRH